MRGQSQAMRATGFVYFVACFQTELANGGGVAIREAMTPPFEGLLNYCTATAIRVERELIRPWVSTVATAK